MHDQEELVLIPHPPKHTHTPILVMIVAHGHLSFMKLRTAMPQTKLSLTVGKIYFIGPIKGILRRLCPDDVAIIIKA